MLGFRLEPHLFYQKGRQLCLCVWVCGVEVINLMIVYFLLCNFEPRRRSNPYHVWYMKLVEPGRAAFFLV